MSRKQGFTKINPMRNALKHMAIKLTKIKDKGKISEATREKEK